MAGLPLQNSKKVSENEDTLLIKNLLEEIGMNPTKVVKTSRLSTSQRNSDTSRQTPTQTLVELASAEDRDLLLLNASKLCKIDKYSSTFVRPDRTSGTSGFP